LFFSAGFETTASALVMCMHELVLNPDVQETLFKEVKDFSESNELSYDTIGKLKYLDCVLNGKSKIILISLVRILSFKVRTNYVT
jgi:cytochrome P450